MAKVVTKGKASAAKQTTPVKQSAPAKRSAPEPEPKKSTAVVRKTGGTALANYDEALEGPTGLERVTAKDLVIPRLTILQDLSPQLKKNRAEYIPEAQVGDFCDTGTGDLFREEMEILPCMYARIYLEWAPRASGKGLVANHGTDPSCLERCHQDDKRRMITPEGNYIAETATFYVLNLSAGNRRSFIPLSSTQLKPARQWMTKITYEEIERPDGTRFQAPIFYRVWTAKPVQTNNTEGDWFLWSFAPGETILERDPTKGLLAQAKDFQQQAARGLIQGDVSGMDDEQRPSGGGGDNQRM